MDPVVASILYADIFDKELSDKRKERWNSAFTVNDNSAEQNEMQATIVMEHIMQASDVSHLMQVSFHGCV